jgi:hypothetical protein
VQDQELRDAAVDARHVLDDLRDRPPVRRGTLSLPLDRDARDLREEVHALGLEQRE